MEAPGQGGDLIPVEHPRKTVKRRSRSRFRGKIQTLPHNKRPRATEFLDFLKQIDTSVPGGLDVHIVMDNYATHKTPMIRAWLARRPHWHVPFTPTSGSWINQVERWFAELTRKQIQRGVHRSVAQLEADIRSFIARHNDNPKPFNWTRSANEILAALTRFCQKTEQTLCGEL